MLPKMFCIANDCAFKPLTAVVRASNKPMRSSPKTGHTSPLPGLLAGPSQWACHLNNGDISNGYKKTAAAMGRRFRFFLPSNGRFCRLVHDDDGACGSNFSATPFMQ